MGHGTQLFGAMLAEIRALGELLAEQTVGVLVAAELPGALRVAELDIETGIDAELRVLGHLGTLVRSQRATQMGRQAADCPCDGIADGFGTVTRESRTVFDRLSRAAPLHAWQVQEHGEAGRAFDQRANRRAAETEKEIAFPMTGNSSFTDLRRPITDHQSIGNESLAAVPSAFAGPPERAARP